MNQWTRVLGWLLLSGGGLGIAAGTAFCLWLAADPQGEAALRMFGPLVIMIAGAWFLPSLVAGFGLLRRTSWARAVAIAVSGWLVPAIPVGTVIGAFGLWVLLGGGRTTAEAPAAPPAAPTPPVTRKPPERGLVLIIAGVGAGFIVFLGTGFRLSGDPTPEPIATAYYPAIAVLAFVLFFAGRAMVQRGAIDDILWTLRTPFRRAAEAEKFRKYNEELNALRAAVAAHPTRRRFLPMIDDGKAWSMAQIEYADDVARRATCVHLQPVEGAMREAGISVRHTWDQYVAADCVVDPAALERRFGPLDSILYAEPRQDDRDGPGPPGALIGCRTCASVINAVHKNDAEPGTPIFPASSSGSGPRRTS